VGDQIGAARAGYEPGQGNTLYAGRRHYLGVEFSDRLFGQQALAGRQAAAV
jgi:hypothetical protein